MKKTKIHLIQSINSDDLYIVDRLENRIEPTCGDVLTPKQVRQWINSRDVTVTVKRAKN